MSLYMNLSGLQEDTCHFYKLRGKMGRGRYQTDRSEPVPVCFYKRGKHEIKNT